MLLIFTILFSGSGLIYLFGPWSNNKVEAVWFNDNWAYRQEIPVNSGAVISIAVVINGTSGCTTGNTVTVAAPGSNGTTATATANVSGGVIASITVNTNGLGYATAPTITIAQGTCSVLPTGTATLNSHTNVFVSFTLDTRSSTTGLINQGKLQSLCQDIRVTDINGKLLPYHIGRTNACDNILTTIDFLPDSLATGTASFYVYYGNPSAQSMDVGSNFATEASYYAVNTLGSEAKATAPLAYWKLDEGTGTSSSDSGTNSFTMSSAGTAPLPTWATEDLCISAKCLQFNGGSAARYQKSYDAKFNITSNVTYNVWAKITQQNSGTWPIILGRSDTHIGYGIRYEKATNKVYFEWGKGNTVCDGASGNYASINFTTSGIDSKWHMYTMTQDGATISLYMDGILATSTTTTPTFCSDTTSAMYIGQDVYGFEDEAKIYNYVRSSAQVLADYNARSNNEGVSAALGSNAQNQPNALNNGLVGYYKFDETTAWTKNCTASPATDSSGNSNNAKSCPSTTGPDQSTTAKYGKSVSSDNTDDYLEVADSSSLDVTNLTLSAWVNLNTNTTGTRTVIQKSTLAGSDGYSLDINSGAIRFCATGGCASSTATLSAATWTHVVVTFDGTTTRFYKDGAFDSSSTTITSVPTNALVLRIGANSSGSNLFNGFIDEARVYNRALSSADVATLYNFAPGPIGEWRFEEGSGSAANDSSGGGNNGVITGATYTSGKFGKALNFGSTDVVNVTGNTPLNLSSSSYTIEFWVNPASIPNNFAAMVGTNNSSCFAATRTNILVGFRSTSSLTIATCADDTDYTYTMSANTWYYVTATYNAVTRVRTLFVNGVSLGTGTQAAQVSTNANWQLGKSPADGSPAFTGKLDNIRIFNYDRTQKQVIEDMNASHPTGGSPIGTPVGYWKFDEGYGTGTSNAHNSGNCGSTCNGNLTNTPTWTNSGKIGKALTFASASSQYIAMPSDVSNLKITSAVTLSAWINLTTSNAIHDIIAKTGASGSFAYRLYTDASGKLNMEISKDGTTITGGTNGATLTGNTTLLNSTWYHVVGVFNPSTSMTLYVNGVQDATTTSVPSAIKDTTTVLDIGAENAGTNLMNGTIDEAKVYAGALSASEILIDMNQNSSQVLGALSDNSTYQKQAANQEYCVPGDSISCVAPVGRWDFEEGSGASAYDTSGGGSTGTITGAIYSNGKQGKALKFNGSTDAVTVSNSLSTKTVEFWVNPSTTTEYFIDLRTAATAASVSVSSGTISAAGFTSPTIYVNGIVSSTLAANSWQHVAITTGTAITANAIRFGRISTTSLTGSLDSIRIFDYARSVKQVVWDYNKGGPAAYWKLDECQGTIANDSSGYGNTATVDIKVGGNQSLAGTCGISYSGTVTTAFAADTKFDDSAETWIATDYYVNAMIEVTHLGTIQYKRVNANNKSNHRLTVQSNWSPNLSAGDAYTIKFAWGWGATGKYNYSINLDGNNDNVTQVASVGIINKNFGTYTNASWGGWVYPTSTVASVDLMFKATEIRAVTDSSGNVICSIWDTTPNPDIWDDASSTTALTLNAWNFVMCTYDGANVKVYVNAVLRNTTAYTNIPITSGADRLHMGEDSAAAFRLTGQIDEMQVYAYDLTQTQINNLYSQGASTRFAPTTGSP